MSRELYGIVLGLALLSQSGEIAAATTCSPGQLAQQQAIAKYITSLEAQGSHLSKKDKEVQDYRIVAMRQELKRMQNLCQPHAEGKDS